MVLFKWIVLKYFIALMLTFGMRLRQSSASPVLPRGLVRLAGMGGVSGLSLRIPAARQAELEQMCQKRPHHLHPTHPPGPGGQPEL